MRSNFSLKSNCHLNFDVIMKIIFGCVICPLRQSSKQIIGATVKVLMGLVERRNQQFFSSFTWCVALNSNNNNKKNEFIISTTQPERTRISFFSRCSINMFATSVKCFILKWGLTKCKNRKETNRMKEIVKTKISRGESKKKLVSLMTLRRSALLRRSPAPVFALSLSPSR